jgi:hypothetical protein
MGMDRKGEVGSQEPFAVGDYFNLVSDTRISETCTNITACES